MDKVVLNDKKIEVKVADGFIYLDTSVLRTERNVVAIHYTCAYDNDGSGCVSFVDVDSKQYIYTQF